MSDLHQDLGIFGIGSDQGMDALGWTALEHLRSALAGHPAAGRIRWHISRAPADMLPAWEGLSQILLLDALPLSDSGDRLRWVTPRELETAGAVSSHGLGIGEVVELAAALALLPRLAILGLVVDPAGPQTPDDWLGCHAQALVEAVREWLPAESRRLG